MRQLVRENKQNYKKNQNQIKITSEKSQKYTSNSSMRLISSNESPSLKITSKDDLFTVKSSRKSPSFSENIPLKSEKERKSNDKMYNSNILNVNMPHFPNTTNSNDSDVLDKNKSLFSKKAKIFDLLDDAEEYTLSHYLEDFKREDLVREYRNLFYKAREIKYLLNEFSQTNKELQRKLERKEEDLSIFHTEMKKAISELAKKSKENELFQTQISEYEQKINGLINENHKKEEIIQNIDNKMQEFSQEYHKLEENIGLLKQENYFLLQKMQQSENYSEELSRKENQIKV